MSHEYTNWLHRSRPDSINLSRCATLPRTFTSTHRASTRVRISSARRWTEITKTLAQMDLTSVTLSLPSLAPYAAAESMDLGGWTSTFGHACSVKIISRRGHDVTEGTRRSSFVLYRVHAPPRRLRPYGPAHAFRFVISLARYDCIRRSLGWTLFSR